MTLAAHFRAALLAVSVVLTAWAVTAGPLEDAAAAVQRNDYDAAMKMLRPLADAGYADAQYALGLMFRKGQGVPQDYAAAMLWYRKAAEQGHAKAQTGLGAGYRKGHGVEQNDQLALKWTLLGAEQGNADAQRGLASIYAAGQGVAPDNITALMWYTIAAVTSQGARMEGGGSAAADRDTLAARMTPDDVAHAQERADEWLRASPHARNPQNLGANK